MFLLKNFKDGNSFYSNKISFHIGMVVFSANPKVGEKTVQSICYRTNERHAKKTFLFLFSTEFAHWTRENGLLLLSLTSYSREINSREIRALFPDWRWPAARGNKKSFFFFSPLFPCSFVFSGQVNLGPIWTFRERNFPPSIVLSWVIFGRFDSLFFSLFSDERKIKNDLGYRVHAAAGNTPRHRSQISEM